MAIYIRKALIEDCDRIHLINKEEMGYIYSIQDARKQLKELLEDDRHAIYVAELNGNVIGYVHANDYTLLYAPPFKNIMGIAVCSKYKRKGVGRMLLDAVETWGMNTGAQGIRLVSGADRQGAHAFYRECGYMESKNQKNFKKYMVD